MATRINTSILLLVFLLAGFFLYCKAMFLVWFSIPTAIVYIYSYSLIARNNLYEDIRLVYFWLTLYMTATTVCLGIGVGFHLYCLSMIPIIFYTEYMGRKLGMRRLISLYVSGVISVCYLVSTVYTAYAGAVYEVDNFISGTFRLVNSVIVIGFLIYYSRLMLQMITDSERALELLAHQDQLTKLYNRHYMMDKLEEALNEGETSYLAIIDIDDFKMINDTYGHNAGDYVLRNVARIMKEVCDKSLISRWGGEEFLILSAGDVNSNGRTLIERLRSKIEDEDFNFNDQHINVTITAGLSALERGRSVDDWIKESDDNLYTGKKNGKNQVVYQKIG